MTKLDEGSGDLRIRPCVPADFDQVLTIINAAAEAYRGVIPPDRWHDPYMSAEALRSEMSDGVVFSVCVSNGEIVGLMGAQPRHNVRLIRHAYVLPGWQGRGVGSRLIGHLCDGDGSPILVGTWRAAEWAIRFYERHGFECVDDDDVPTLLRAYWSVPERQIETSVVLALPPLSSIAAHRVVSQAQPVAKAPDMGRSS